MQKIFFFLGGLFLLAGLLYPFLRKFNIGRLPGDLHYQSDTLTVVFPIVTCVILSVIVTLFLNFFR